MNFIINKEELNLEGLQELTKKPELFAKDPVNFWQDPYISDHILYAHLDEDSDEGSRNYATIIKSVIWISDFLNLPAGSKLLDLGCGPGLYSEQFHGQGFEVTGIDFSANSIRYAREQAEASNWPIEYICQDYLSINYTEEFDVITLIYGDLCVLSNEDRSKLLKKVWKALKPGGHLICDVFTKNYFKKSNQKQSWYISLEEGFWKPEEHLLLQHHYKYKKDKVRLDKYTLIKKDGEMQTYHIWKQYFNPLRAEMMLKDHNFELKEKFSDLCGTPYTDKSEWIGMVAQKK
ncbi:MAG: methyltransferase domain-containing protein [Marinifilaceae bacterium]